MQAFGVSAMPALARAIGANYDNARNWAKRGHIPFEWLVRASRMTGASIDWFKTGSGQPPPRSGQTDAIESPDSGLELAGAPGFVQLPRLSGRASAGNGDHIEEADDAPVIAFDPDWLGKHVGRTGPDLAAFEVAGSSMEPTLWDGQIALVDLRSREVGAGGVFVLRDGSDRLVKRLMPVIGGTVEVVSDNPRYTGNSRHAREDIEIVGRVVWPRVR